MELAFIVWAVGTLPALAKGLCVFGFIGTILAALGKVVCLCGGIDRKDKEKEHPADYMTANFCHKALFWFIPLWITGVIIPDKTTSYQMLAAYGVQTLAENPAVQDLGKDGVDVLKALMAKAKKELETESK